MKPTDMMLLTTLTVLVLVLAHVHGAPSRDTDLFPEIMDSDTLARRILGHLADYKRLEKKAQMDAGFLSRHNALRNFLASHDAKMQASDAYGPGRRK